jgi:hypothetical protein
MQFALATIHDDNYKDLAEITWYNNRELYANRHGYKKIAKTDGFDNMNIGFAKIKLLLDIFTQNTSVDAIHWSGTDTMITNWSIPLSEFIYDNYHVTIATDFNGIQSDSFLVRNTMEGRAWLSMILDNMQSYLSHPFLEQGVMMETYHQYQHIIKVVPQRFLNSYHYPLYYSKGARNNQDKLGFNGQWYIGDFLIHAPDQPMNIRLDLFNKVSKMIIR